MVEHGLSALVHVVFLVILPPAVLILAAVYLFVRLQNWGAGFVLIGSILVFLSSLDFIFNLVMSFYVGPSALGQYALVGSMIFGGMHGAGVVAIAIGLLLVVERVRGND